MVYKVRYQTLVVTIEMKQCISCSLILLFGMVYIWGLLCYVMFLLLKLEVAINLICCCAKIPRNSEKFN